ncbi:hypothetical protein [Mucilaginibacter ginsenosidivorax]|uniref:NERD domain-containing protein n=1 Tax=Mucilaginibacter ginsenosidivorax TaxID=862126 RepID=A0A5B8W460_9SPHI|nr:hypothetical protein [Mucilaginibacter ginsenosidivorax]QEC78614.1 hypothetical protein FSB76_22680 [Mucilaginibacter ginsenosidivorax]
MDDVYAQLSKAFCNFSKDSIILLLSSLNVFPENHSQRIRITTALQAAIRMEAGDQAARISPAQLAEVLERVFIPGTDAWNIEDPQEILFTELFLFHGGNFIIFPEVFADSHNGLRNLVDTIFMTENKFPKAFKEEVFFAVSALLIMSDQVAARMDYRRNSTSPERHHEPVFFPSRQQQEAGLAAVQFLYDDILKPDLNDIAIRKAIIDTFTCKANSPFIATDDHMNSPVATRPLYQIGNQLIIINLQGIAAALVHFIVKKILQYKILDSFLAEYKRVLKERVRNLIRRIDFDEIENVPAVSSGHPLFELELLYKFDEDKLAWITIIPDLFKSYNTEIFFTKENHFIPAEVLLKRKEAISEYLLNHYPNHEVLYLDVYAPVGREFAIALRQAAHKIVALTFSDLRYVTLRDSGSDGLRFWHYFRAREDYALHGEIRSFSFLDSYAYFKLHEDSFYLTDEHRYPSVWIDIGLANDFRKEAQDKTDIHLVPLANALVEVEKRFSHREINIYLPNESNLLPRQYVENDHVSFWVHVQFSKRSNPVIRQTAWMLMESVAYWLWEIGEELQRPFVNENRIIIHYELILKDEEKYAGYTFDEAWDPETVLPLFSAMAKPQLIEIIVPFELAYLVNGMNNNNDRVILRWLITGYNHCLSSRGLEQLLNADEIIEKYAPKGKKTMMMGFDTLKNPMLHAHQLPEPRFVADFEIQSILNDLGLNAAPGYPVGDLVTVREKNKLSNAIVAYHFNALKEMINNFPSQSLLHYLLAMNESLWRLKHMTGQKITSRLACFSRVPSMRQEIIDENLEIEEATLALRCLIEIVVAIPPSGNKMVNNKDYDRMLALTKEIIVWGTISDELNFGVNELDLGVLPSGRVGSGKKFLNESIRPYNVAKKNEAIDERVSKEEMQAVGTSPVKEKRDNSTREHAFEAEFGFNWSTYLDMLMTLVDQGFETPDGVVVRSRASIIRLIQERYPLKEELIDSFLQQFSLSTRGTWETLPDGYRITDIYPWRYTRSLSLMRKPIMEIVIGGQNLFYWGMRQALLSYQYLDDIISDGRYNARSAAMKSYISTLLHEKGKRFTRAVFAWLTEVTAADHYIIDREVKIDERGKLQADKNYGDIDILIIDLNLKKIISVECKHVTPARITSEFASELKKFESEWIGKHLKRHKWLVANLAEIVSVYKLINIADYQIKSIFLTSEKIPFPFITKNYKGLPFYDFQEWKRNPNSLSSL